MTARLIPCPDRAAWLAARRQGIGSSDAPAILGVSPWNTAAGVYCSKLQLVPDGEESPAMRWGTRLEPVIAAAYEEETGHPLTGAGEIYQHPEYPWMLATPDRLRADRRIVELKTANAFAADHWGEPGTDQVPDTYQLQVQHQMIVLDCAEADIAVLIGGSDFRIYTLTRHEGLIRHLTEIEAAFWERVQLRQMPEPDWQHASTPALIQSLHGLDPDRQIDLGPDALELIEQYERFGQVEAESRSQRAALKARLLHLLGEAGLGMLPDGRRVRRKEIRRNGYTVEPSSYVEFRILSAPKARKRP